MNAPALKVRPAKPEPLAQIELLVLFAPGLQSGGPRVPATLPPNRTHMWLTVDVHGRHGTSDETGLPCIDDMSIEHAGEDVTNLLEPLADEIANYITHDK